MRKMRGESRSDRDKRIRKLWETLDTRHEGHLDLKGFQRGLKRMDHREYLSERDIPHPPNWWPQMLLTTLLALKNADGLLHEILEAVDTSGDGRIQFNGEPRDFAEPCGTHPRMRANCGS